MDEKSDKKIRMYAKVSFLYMSPVDSLYLYCFLSQGFGITEKCSSATRLKLVAWRFISTFKTIIRDILTTFLPHSSRATKRNMKHPSLCQGPIFASLLLLHVLPRKYRYNVPNVRDLLAFLEGTQVLLIFWPGRSCDVVKQKLAGLDTVVGLRSCFAYVQQRVLYHFWTVRQSRGHLTQNSSSTFFAGSFIFWTRSFHLLHSTPSHSQTQPNELFLKSGSSLTRFYGPTHTFLATKFLLFPETISCSISILDRYLPIALLCHFFVIHNINQSQTKQTEWTTVHDWI